MQKGLIDLFLKILRLSLWGGDLRIQLSQEQAEGVITLSK